jgi:putative toxin-antitoxin system antitoxin component (TIGR02293 family)
MMQVAQISKILGGPKVLHAKVHQPQDLIVLSHHGVTKDALLNLTRYLCFSLKQIGQLLPISERTIQRYSRRKHFSRPVSEQILQIAEVAARGVQVFEDKDNFLAWMKQSNVALGGKSPESMLSTRFGTQMVLDELGRIEHGVVS